MTTDTLRFDLRPVAAELADEDMNAGALTAPFTGDKQIVTISAIGTTHTSGQTPAEAD